MLPRFPTLRILCFLTLAAFTSSQQAFSQTPPASPTELAFVRGALVDASSEVWKVQWQDNSTNEDGFEIFTRVGGGHFGLNSFKKIPTSLSLTNATTTSGSTIVTCASTADLGVGWGISGANIPSGAVVASVKSDTTFVLDLAALGTGTSTGQTLDAASVYKGASGYTYVMELKVPSAQFMTYWGGWNYYPYNVEWFVLAYRNTLPTAPVYSGSYGYTNRPMIAPAPYVLAAPTSLAVTTPEAGEFHVTYYDGNWFEAYLALEYKRHDASTWSAVRVDYSGAGTMSVDLTNDASQTRLDQTAAYLGKLYMGFERGVTYDFRACVVDFAGNKSAYSDTATATVAP